MVSDKDNNTRETVREVFPNNRYNRRLAAATTSRILGKPQLSYKKAEENDGPAIWPKPRSATYVSQTGEGWFGALKYATQVARILLSSVPSS